MATLSQQSPCRGINLSVNIPIGDNLYQLVAMCAMLLLFRTQALCIGAYGLLWCQVLTNLAVENLPTSTFLLKQPHHACVRQHPSSVHTSVLDTNCQHDMQPAGKVNTQRSNQTDPDQSACKAATKTTFELDLQAVK